MKTSAIIRIIAFSIAIVVLTGLLIAGINYNALPFWWKSESDELQAGPVVSSDAEGISMGAVSTESISELEIEWAAGTITIVPGEEANTIRFWDDYIGDEKYLLYYEVHDGQLCIQYARGLDWHSGFGITLNDVQQKNLTVQIPADWVCQKLEIDSASAALEMHDLTIQTVDINTASGKCVFGNCNFYALDIDTASGDVIYSGSLHSLDCDAASAAITACFDNIPSRVDVDTMSSNVDITLPDHAGFTANMQGLSTQIESEFDCTSKNGAYVCGDGGCRIDVDSVSGKLHIRRNPNTADAHHQHTDTCELDPSSCPDKAYTGAHHEESSGHHG